MNLIWAVLIMFCGAVVCYGVLWVFIHALPMAIGF